MTMHEVREWIFERADREAKSWFERQCQNPFSRYYLYYTDGDLGIFEDEPIFPGWKLGHPQRISPSWTIEQARQFVIENSRRLPCLPVD